MVQDERRRGDRFDVRRECFAGWGDQQQRCLLADISVIGALLICDVKPPLGTRVRLTHALIGGLGGLVCRHSADGFALAFEENQESVLYALRAITLGMSDPDVTQ